MQIIVHVFWNMSFGTCPLSKLITGRIIFVHFHFNVTWKLTPILNLSNNFGLTGFGKDNPWPRNCQSLVWIDYDGDMIMQLM